MNTEQREQRLPESAEDLATSVAKWMKDGSPSWALDGLTQLTARAARLRTVEQECDELARLAYEANEGEKRLEARVEALEAALADAEHEAGRILFCSRADDAAHIARDIQVAARAVLAPSQQEEAKCNGNCICAGSLETLVEDLTCPVHGVEAQEAASHKFADRQVWFDSPAAPSQDSEQ